MPDRVAGAVRRPWPGCGSELVELKTTWACRPCPGAWAPAAIVNVLIEQMGRDTPRIEPIGPGDRRCPECGSTLVRERLEEVEVDRCRNGHGVWFDDGELVRVLMNAG